MLDFIINKIGPNSNSLVQIKQWTVAFMTPFGLYDTLKEAVERVSPNDLDPQMCVIPVVLAIGENGYQEIVSR